MDEDLWLSGWCRGGLEEGAVATSHPAPDTALEASREPRLQRSVGLGVKEQARWSPCADRCPPVHTWGQRGRGRVTDAHGGRLQMGRWRREGVWLSYVSPATTLGHLWVTLRPSPAPCLSAEDHGAVVILGPALHNHWLLQTQVPPRFPIRVLSQSWPQCRLLE